MKLLTLCLLAICLACSPGPDKSQTWAVKKQQLEGRLVVPVGSEGPARLVLMQKDSLNRQWIRLEGAAADWLPADDWEVQRGAAGSIATH
jgi:hypothetical protein